jgi:hypothetical protein
VLFIPKALQIATVDLAGLNAGKKCEAKQKGELYEKTA